MNPAIDVLAVGIGVVLAGSLWLLSEDFFDHYGVTPWGIAPGAWVLLVAVIALFAVIVPSRAGLAGVGGLGLAGLWSLARVTTWEEVVGARDHDRWLADQRAKRAGWFADPDGRHERRYFDGRRWTEWVFDDGAQGSDPVGDGRAAPVPAWSGRLLPPPAWHLDPTGRHCCRYWDGERWTGWVSDGAETGLDLPS